MCIKGKKCNKMGKNMYGNGTYKYFFKINLWTCFLTKQTHPQHSNGIMDRSSWYCVIVSYLFLVWCTQQDGGDYFFRWRLISKWNFCQFSDSFFSRCWFFLRMNYKWFDVYYAMHTLFLNSNLCAFTRHKVLYSSIGTFLC